MGMNNEEIMESGTIIIEMIFFFVAIHVLRSCFQLIWWLCTDFIPMTYGKIKRTSQSVCLGVTERMSRCHRAYVSVSQSVCRVSGAVSTGFGAWNQRWSEIHGVCDLMRFIFTINIHLAYIMHFAFEIGTFFHWINGIIQWMRFGIFVYTV